MSNTLSPLPVSKDQPVILVADDDRGTRRMLRQVMEQEGYKVIEANNGQECLELNARFSPDLILLDALMPVISGFEACQQIQQQPPSQRPPVLMVTSLEDEISVDQAFKVGAIDYITKPINWAVLRQRVRRLLATHQMESLRDDLIHMIVHDMKNPLAAISGHLELLLDQDLNTLEEHQHDSVLRAYRNTQNLLDMIMMILDLRRLEENKLALLLETTSINELLYQTVDNLDWMSQSYGVEVIIDCPQPGLRCILDRNLTGRVLVNLIANAIKHSPRGNRVTVTAKVEANRLLISVHDEGEGITLEDQLHIFDRYGQASQRKGGSRTDTGLGLTFCKLAVEAHGGHIELTSKIGEGSVFTLIFPLNSAAILIEDGG